ncbi:MAG: phenylalanine--tRNA ligase subunit alpha [Bacteriovoracales bacterium]|nr:phenylalanine--tRNA ligase subunit alpha [Bacteriovoracales bacterium]
MGRKIFSPLGLLFFPPELPLVFLPILMHTFVWESMDMLKELEQLKSDFKTSLSKAATKTHLLELKSVYLGKKGKLSSILKGLKEMGPKERKTLGQKSNEYKREIETALSKKMEALEVFEIDEKLKKTGVDPTYRESLFDLGLMEAGLHPVTLVQREVEDIFLSMGLDILDGPHIEDDYHNFEALNIPADHPARDMQDTFWFKDLKHLLRTHTSTIQIRGMKMQRPPFKFVGPGKVFRSERTDASHEMVFHQLEGMMVDKDLSVANLIYFMKTLLTEVFGKETEVRLRPGFFPFVEPGFELDIRCQVCHGKGCRVCKQSGWVELLPCGMVHPNVLRFGRIDPSVYNGFAFGLGLDRLVMMKYGIDDIRHIHGGDLRFISQFRMY